MRILVLGGTQFVGRSYVEEALAAGHEVTLFNRGRTRPDLFPDAERIRGDRGEDLSALAVRSWDAVFDPSCYLPRLARMSAEALADAAPHYTVVSTLSVYADGTLIGQDETGRLATIDDPATEDVTGETYGALKVLAEDEIRRVYGDRALIVRPASSAARTTTWTGCRIGSGAWRVAARCSRRSEAHPWWVPPQEIAVIRFDASRALAAGLEVRPIEESFRDCWAWDRTRANEPPQRDRGLPPEREAELLDAWHAQTS